MSNAELIERARELRMDAEKGNQVERMRMLGELANALADAERERDEYMERFRNVSDANSDILDQLWAAQSVIAEAKRSLDYGGERHYLERIYATQNALSQSPADALQAVKATTWDEGAKWAAVECGAIRDERNGWIAPGDNPYRAVSSTPEQPEGGNR